MCTGTGQYVRIDWQSVENRISIGLYVFVFCCGGGAVRSAIGVEFEKDVVSTNVSHFAPRAATSIILSMCHGGFAY